MAQAKARTTTAKKRFGKPRPMREVTANILQHERARRLSVEIGGSRLPLAARMSDSWGPSPHYKPETTTLWTFPDRGSWATHSGDYRGNWSPYIPRNLILRYTKPGDVVLDQMSGSGTTLVEARLTGRNAVGVDANLDAVLLARSRLEFDIPLEVQVHPSQALTFHGDARRLDKVPSESVDLIATHPPYANIIRYSRTENPMDLSQMPFRSYLQALGDIARESFRVVKPGRHCAILIGETRKRQHQILLSTALLQIFLKAGFVLKEDIIKAQHNMKRTREAWGGRYDFLLLSHEHLFVFRKPLAAEIGQLRWSKLPWLTGFGEAQIG